MGPETPWEGAMGVTNGISALSPHRRRGLWSGLLDHSHPLFLRRPGHQTRPIPLRLRSPWLTPRSLLSVSRDPLKRTTPKSCGPAPTCFLNLTLFPLAYLPLLCTSHLLSLPACVPPSEVFLFCPLADHRQPCCRLQAPEGPTFCRYLWLRFSGLDLITLSRL